MRLPHFLNSNKKLIESDELIVFQVNFTRNESLTGNERIYLNQYLNKEAIKIEIFSRRGLKKYYIITSTKGTAHYDTGSIDRLNEFLSDQLNVESYVWWRDDIDRRVDLYGSVKWSYPDILKATDLLEVLVSGLLGEHEERRRSAIRAYLAAQYDSDRELKFKQVELQSEISDLFIDLPIALVEKQGSQHFLPQRRLVQWSSGRTEWREAGRVYDRRLDPHDEQAASMILGNPSQALNRMVIEGAPGLRVRVNPRLHSLFAK